jgi:site-specific recombinase XerD
VSAFKRGKNQQLYLPLRSGGLVQRSTGTSSLAIRNKMKAIVAELRAADRWALLEAVAVIPEGKTRPRLTLLQLYRANAAKQLDQLEAQLAAIAIADVRTAWLTAVASRLGGSEDERSSVQNYAQQLDTFLELYPDATTADLTPETVTAWLASREKTGTGTRRKYFYAMRSLVGFLIETGRLATDPLVRMKPPKKGQPRVRWETVETDRLIVAACSPQYRALIAWIKATGADVSSGFRVYRRDLDLAAGKCRLPGSKTGRRIVQEGLVEAWAIPILREYVTAQGFMPSALLWPAPAAGATVRTGPVPAEGFTAHRVSHHHNRVCKALGITGYTLKDSRHSVAVRMRKRGYELDEVAEQLGTSLYQVSTVYARFKPELAHRDAEVRRG